MSAVADVLNGAADLIERDGWRQGARVADNDPPCAAIAIGRSCWHDVDVYFAATETFRATIGAWIVPWNDTPGRTKAEVVAALRAAAERAA